MGSAWRWTRGRRNARGRREREVAVHRRDRYDVTLMDELKAELDRFLDKGSLPSHGPASEDASSALFGE